MSSFPYIKVITWCSQPVAPHVSLNGIVAVFALFSKFEFKHDHVGFRSYSKNLR